MKADRWYLDRDCGPWLAVSAGHHGEGAMDGTHWLVKMYTSCWTRAAASRWTQAIHCLSGTQLSEKSSPPYSSFHTVLTSLSPAPGEGGVFLSAHKVVRERTQPHTVRATVHVCFSDIVSLVCYVPLSERRENSFHCKILMTQDLRA